MFFPEKFTQFSLIDKKKKALASPYLRDYFSQDQPDISLSLPDIALSISVDNAVVFSSVSSRERGVTTTSDRFTVQFPFVSTRSFHATE